MEENDSSKFWFNASAITAFSRLFFKGCISSEIDRLFFDVGVGEPFPEGEIFGLGEGDLDAGHGETTGILLDDTSLLWSSTCCFGSSSGCLITFSFSTGLSGGDIPQFFSSAKQLDFITLICVLTSAYKFYVITLSFMIYKL